MSPVPASARHRYDHPFRKGHVPDVRRVRRVRALDEQGTGCLWFGLGESGRGCNGYGRWEAKPLAAVILPVPRHQASFKKSRPEGSGSQFLSWSGISLPTVKLCPGLLLPGDLFPSQSCLRHLDPTRPGPKACHRKRRPIKTAPGGRRGLAARDSLRQPPSLQAVLRAALGRSSE